MADMCSNKMYITGPKDVIDDFMNAARGPTASGEDSWLSFHKLHPDPHMPLDPIPKTIDWYNWRIKNWGTKWETVARTPDFSTLDNLRNQRTYSFDTAWAPPKAFVKYVSRKWPTIEFELKYHDRSTNRSGRFKYKAGTCLK